MRQRSRPLRRCRRRRRSACAPGAVAGAVGIYVVASFTSNSSAPGAGSAPSARLIAAAAALGRGRPDRRRCRFRGRAGVRSRRGRTVRPRVRTIRIISRFGCAVRQTAQVRVGYVIRPSLRHPPAPPPPAVRSSSSTCLRRAARPRSGRRHAGLRADVDPPAGQLGGKTRVLALLADGKAELPLGDDDVGDLVLLVDPDARAPRPG